MNLEEIETFLKIVECNNIMQASELLYISQSTASTRMQCLEEELGYPLIIRQKGHRNITLTDHGQTFLPIARGLMGLWKDALDIEKNGHKMEIIIGATDSVNNFILQPFYHEIIENYPEYYLNIQTHHSHEIYRLVDQQKIDLGFVSNLYPYSNIDIQELYHEELVIIADQTFDLDHYYKYDEIYTHYSDDYEIYHHTYLKDANLLLTAGTISMCLRLLNPQRYTIVPLSIARVYILNHTEYKIFHLKDPFIRRGYMIQNKYGRKDLSKIIDLIKIK